MNIAFFLSDHGNGHLMRNLPVAKQLVEKGHKVLVVCGEKHCKIASEYVPSVICVPYHTDIGLILKENSLSLDKEHTSSLVYNYIDNWENDIEFGCELIKKYSIEKVVVDIVPWALISAHRSNVFSILMASFTWVEQYASFLDKTYLEKLINAYQLADLNIFYPLINEPTRLLLKKGVEVGFVSREFDNDAIAKIKKQHLNKKIVFVSLGAINATLGKSIDVSKLNYDFIVSPNLSFVGDNVTTLSPLDNNSHNYLMAADYCISKAGWTTISEVMLTNSKFAVLQREDIPEDTMLIEKLTKGNNAISISIDELNDIDAVLKKMDTAHFGIRKNQNDVRHIVIIIETRN